MPDDVRAECRRRFGDRPCITIYKRDGGVVETHDCATWCPLLNKAIEDNGDEGGVDGRNL